MGRLFLAVLSCFLLCSLLLHFVIKGRDIDLESRKSMSELALVSTLIGEKLENYIQNLQMLVFDNTLIDGIMKSKREFIETRIDGLIPIMSDCELVVVSNIRGQIIASNTVNKHVKSFSNDTLIGRKADLFEWYGRDKKVMPLKIDGIEAVKGGVPALLFDNMHGKYFFEIVSAIMDVTGSRIGVVTAYFNLDGAERIVKSRNMAINIGNDGEHPDNGGLKGTEYGLSYVRLINSVALERVKAASLLRKSRIDLFGVSLYEFYWFAVLLVFWGFVFVFVKSKYGVVIESVLDKKAELSMLRASRAFLEGCGIYVYQDKLVEAGKKKGFVKTEGGKSVVVSAELVEEISEPVSNRLIASERENQELKKQVGELSDIREEYDNISRKTADLGSRLDSIYVSVGRLIKYLDKVDKRKEIELGGSRFVESRNDMVGELDDVITKRERIIDTLRDLAEEASMLLNLVYPLSVDVKNREQGDFFDSIKKRLRFFILNIGALEGFFKDVNMDGITGMFKEYVELKRDNHRLKELSDIARSLEGDLGFYKKALKNTISSLKEIEQGVLESDLTDYI
ncbi:MAG: hypothetical protein JXA66_02245 [Oligoflexia bacterium]|nr:hypothetical protein [Oligoflexia bacterium]